MRGFLMFLVAAGAMFVDALIIRWLSNAIMHPYGQHGYTYWQAFDISFIFTVSGLAAIIIFGLIRVILD